MDPYGNFVVVWANQRPGRKLLQRHHDAALDKNGDLVGNEVEVNNETTNIEFSPAVAMGANDAVVVTWSDTNNPSYLINQTAIAQIYTRAFSPQEAPLWNQLAVAGGGYETVSMDGQDNFIISWEANQDNDVGGAVSEGVYATEYQLEYLPPARRWSPRRSSAPRSGEPPPRIQPRRPSGLFTRIQPTW